MRPNDDGARISEKLNKKWRFVYAADCTVALRLYIFSPFSFPAIDIVQAQGDREFRF
jgi:hypothetical protein